MRGKGEGIVQDPKETLVLTNTPVLNPYIRLLLLPTYCSTLASEANAAVQAPLLFHSIQGSSSPKKLQFPLNPYFDSSYLIWVWRPFNLALDGWPKRTTFGNPSYCIRKVCPSYVIVSLGIVIESGKEPSFS